MELLISCGDEVEMGRRSPMIDGIYKITFLQRGILITQFFLKKKKRVKKEATGVLAMKETLFSDGRYEEPTVQYNRVGCFPQSVHADQCLHSPYYLLNKYSCLLTQKTNPVWTPTCLFVHKLKADVLFMASY